MSGQISPPSRRPTPDAPFSYKDLSQSYRIKDTSFIPHDIKFFDDPGHPDQGVHVVTLDTPISLPVPTVGSLAEQLRVVDSTGVQVIAKPEYIVFAWEHLSEIKDRKESTIIINERPTAYVAYLIAALTRLYLVQNWGPPDSNMIWNIPGTDGRQFDFKQRVLLSLRNIAPGCWQPIFTYAPRRLPSLAAKKARKPRAPIKRPLMFIVSRAENFC
ncbi:hypothetical protein SISSUDRAFT_1068087 [Sistotremastrum suecicum HHB10207 ss-3]|uniref:Uncharacterized protein n=1 Tax=Sistotremastrum suecicum HHB10207 ss-3 TaxID=1314776 RepID=A0A165WG11_9AGAM|nr:hypothetical protein SISSUDRAFT_1068087 [Sistotremastrum suecicum HHB10207 ss-3]